MKIAAAFLAVMVLAADAQASEESEALTARGLVELNAGRANEAMDFFDRAVSSDPRDAMARYHRGVALAKERKFEEALVDLREANQLEPDFTAASLEIGVCLVELGRNEEGRPWLERARADSKLEGQASFFLGIANLREGRLDEARADFERARATDPSVEVTSRYYLGVVAYRSGGTAAARDHFAFVEEESPDSAVGREATSFLELIRQGDTAQGQVYGGLSLQYDTNVVLAPAQGLPAGSISDQADGRVTINAGGVWVPWRSENAQLSLGYDFYQNVQFQLTDYDLTDNRPTVQFAADLGPLRTAVLTQYDYYLLDYSNFLSEVTVLPWIVYPSTIGRTELYFRFRWRDYLQESFDILDGYNYAGGLRQVFVFGDKGQEAWISYQVDNQDPDTVDGDLYGYEGNAVETAVIWPLPWTTTVQVGYRFRREDYDNASAAFVPVGEPRLDKEHRVGVAFRKDLTQLVSLVAAWIGTFNLSNKQDFEYDRQIGSIGVEVRY